MFLFYIFMIRKWFKIRTWFAFSFMVKEFYLPKYIKNKLPLCPHGFLFIFEFHFIRRTWNRFTTLERSRIQNGGGRRTLPCTGNFNKLYPTHLKKTLLKYVCIKWITFSISIIQNKKFSQECWGAYFSTSDLNKLPLALLSERHTSP